MLQTHKSKRKDVVSMRDVVLANIACDMMLHHRLIVNHSHSCGPAEAPGAPVAMDPG